MLFIAYMLYVHVLQANENWTGNIYLYQVYKFITAIDFILSIRTIHDVITAMA